MTKYCRFIAALLNGNALYKPSLIGILSTSLSLWKRSSEVLRDENILKTSNSNVIGPKNMLNLEKISQKTKLAYLQNDVKSATYELILTLAATRIQPFAFSCNGFIRYKPLLSSISILVKQRRSYSHYVHMLNVENVCICTSIFTYLSLFRIVRRRTSTIRLLPRCSTATYDIALYRCWKRKTQLEARTRSAK